MKSRVLKLLPVVLVLVFFYFWLGSRTAPRPDAFASGRTVQAGLDEGAKAGLPVLLLVTADWCGPCQSLKSGALTDPRVRAFITVRTVPVYVDATSGVPAPVDAMGIRGFPTLLLLNGGREVSRLEGAHGADEMLRWLEASLGRFNPAG